MLPDLPPSIVLLESLQHLDLHRNELKELPQGQQDRITSFTSSNFIPHPLLSLQISTSFLCGTWMYRATHSLVCPRHLGILKVSQRSLSITTPWRPLPLRFGRRRRRVGGGEREGAPVLQWLSDLSSGVCSRGDPHLQVPGECGEARQRSSPCHLAQQSGREPPEEEGTKQ